MARYITDAYTLSGTMLPDVIGKPHLDRNGVMRPSYEEFMKKLNRSVASVHIDPELGTGLVFNRFVEGRS